jgi:SAM-dependent methyltransferase
MPGCRICNCASGLASYEAREMMFGLRETFTYYECPKCQCLQIAEVPKDLDRFYPDGYYSYAAPVISRALRLKRGPRRLRLLSYLGDGGGVGRLLLKAFGPPSLPEFVDKLALKPDARILDVGCGMGRLLIGLWREGFANLAGVDPYVAADWTYRHHIHIRKAELADLDGPFDVIVFAHSYEHMSDPVVQAGHVAQLLAPGGHAVFSMPVVPCLAWTKYRACWVDLDAPRHLFIHSQKSMAIIAQRVGLRITDVVYDSDAFQFTGSELYVRDIPMKDPRSQTPFPAEQVQAWEAQSRALNAEGMGGRATFYLKKS